MGLLKTGQFKRNVFVTLAIAFLSVSFIPYKHVVPRGQRQWIALQHQMRRVFSRAERENIKSAVAPEEIASLPNSPPQVGDVPSGWKYAVVCYQTFSVAGNLTKPKSFFLDRSTVLNL